MDNETKLWGKLTLEKCIEKYKNVVEEHKNGIPYTTDKNGNYDNRADESTSWSQDDGLNWWTNGFWGGIIWHLYKNTNDEKYVKIANISEKLMDKCFDDFYGLHHDVGFMWIPTAVTNYMFTKNEASKKRALHAANLLAGRFNVAGGFIRAWNDIPGENSDTRGWAIIDCMFNIPLLHWASKETCDPRYKCIANIHADTVAQSFIREDGSCNHIVEFDPENGGVAKTHGGQGYAADSAWTRGQAWALYGFTVNYNLSGKKNYLETAKRSANYFLSKMPQSGIIPIDFDQPTVPELEDSCAAAIAACGFLELGKVCHGLEKQKYEDAAIKILKVLDTQRANYSASCDAIVSNCSAAYHSKESHHIYMVYADYFYIEALNKIANENSEFIW